MRAGKQRWRQRRSPGSIIYNCRIFKTRKPPNEFNLSSTRNKDHLRPDGRSLRIIAGDITEQGVDAIVNAANGMLAHGGGVAGAIARKGGSQITSESRRWVEEHGRVPTGGAAITGGGDLKARYVIHAVGPVWGGGSQDEERLLAGAVQSALSLADEHGLASIALPAISTGIFGYPIDRAVPTMVNAVIEYMDGHPGSSLRDIRLCDMNKAAVALFAEELGRREAGTNRISSEQG
ncbi:MAG: macro domain-containing protein [Chloroflexi bacterium]|nr:MAG: macro domain-containing protein [Chloroflexota bacterium]